MRRSLAIAGLVLGLAAPAIADDPTLSPLPVLTIDPDAISVIGVSSGGYMATQLAVAFPERFHGLGVFAAGPWGCAQGALSRALRQCMQASLGPPELNDLAERHAEYRDNGQVGPREELTHQRVYIWHGEADTTVDPTLGATLAEQYRAWLDDGDAQLRLEMGENAGHGWPVDNQGDTSTLADCAEGGSPHLLACDVDGAGDALSWLYENLEPPERARPGMLWTFDQAPFDGGRSFDEQGYLFVPKVCEEGAECGLVVALHGCDMGRERIGETFVRHSGLNEWAATNELIVLYPQATASLPNPRGCWDWWGYAESAWQPDPLHDTRDGRQVSAIMDMVEQLAGLAPPVESARH
ncbi:depolymerase [Litchfieldella qijiaojingensis]|uniref:Depolymerase n=1 Tax=Litchfieldella qijiaojingensis TaxID=980347 RepID=A0ABQ2YI07_9GAMM|nr:PHB depolymerase family esterase [Halomonas qijiaojingensis]GGX84785.1 depolymerase [Halomonas qijiaojingensis]